VRRVEDERLPTKQAARDALALQTGQDGTTLLATIFSEKAPAWLREVPAIDVLRRVWLQNYLWQDEQLCWRENDNIPPASQFISSPHDLEAHYARKHTTQWIGYKLYVTETCDDDHPHLITHIETTPGPVADGDVTPIIYAALRKREILPATHIVDTGFLDAELMVDSRSEYDVDLFGPTRQDYHWQSQAGEGFAAQDFVINWDEQKVTCPPGRTSISWTTAVDKRTNDVIKIKFSTKDCRQCACINQCVRSKKQYPRRTLTIRPKPQYEALQAARQREMTKDFHKEYDRRAGIEGTISRGIRATRLRQTRYRGLDRVRLAHILTRLGLNALRLGEWFLETERSKTRITPFARVMRAAAA
jgi:transposase